MFGWRRFVGAVSLALLLCGSRGASAQLLLATPEGAPVGVEHVELAYAYGDGSGITWLALRLSGEPLAVVAALPEGASAEMAADAWLEALELTASPRVLLPRGESDCGDASRYFAVSLPRSRGVEPEVLELASEVEVTDALAKRGLRSGVALPAASRYLVWSFAASKRAVTTRTLRVQVGATPLPFLPGFRVPIALSAVTRGPSALLGEAAASALPVTFTAGPSRSHDYLQQVRAWDEEHDEPLLEARSRALLFDWTIHADLVTIAPLMRSYAARAVGEGVGLDAEQCSRALNALRSEPDLSAARAACGWAEDAWLALEAAGPSHATLARFRLSSEAPPSELEPGGEPQAPLVRASVLDTSACPPGALGEPIVIGHPVQVGGGSWPREAEPEEAVVVERYHEVGCSGGAYVEADEPSVLESHDDEPCEGEQAEDGTCNDEGREPYYDDGYDGETCSADSSSSSEPSEACSSDSSGSSSTDDACTGDSSSASGDSGCSSGPGEAGDGGYDGETCTGKAAPERTRQSASSRRNKAGKRPQRVKVSLWSVALAALVLPIRRRKRGP